MTAKEAIFTSAAPAPKYDWQTPGFPITTYRLRLMTEEQAAEHGLLEQYRMSRSKSLIKMREDGINGSN